MYQLRGSATHYAQQLQQLDIIVAQTFAVYKLRRDAIHAHLMKDLDRIAYLKSLDAPVARLPPEILGMIFVFYSKQSPPQRLRLVSQRWRTTVDSTPQLWERVSFKPFRHNIAVASEVLTHWAQRAGACPLNITLDLNSGRAIEPDAEQWLELAKCLCRALEGRQLESLDVLAEGTATPYTVLSPFITLLASNASPGMLKRVVFEVSRKYSRPPPLSEQDVRTLDLALRRESALEVVHLPGALMSDCSAALYSVRHLSLSAMDPDRIPLSTSLPVLSDSSALTTLYISGCAPSGTHIAFEDDLTLPKLQELTIRHLRDVAGFFHHLRAPALRTLRLDNIGGRAATSQLNVGLRAFIGRCQSSHPPIVELCLEGTPMAEDTLTWILSNLPTLEILRISHTAKLSSVTFNVMNKRPSRFRRNWVGGQLRVLEIGKLCTAVTHADVTSLVRARAFTDDPEYPRARLTTVTWEGKDMIQQTQQESTGLAWIADVDSPCRSVPT